MSKSNGEIEFILPSGKFCIIRPLRVRDRIAAFAAVAAGKAKGVDLDLGVCLAMQAVKVDDEPLTYEQWLDLDVRDDNAIGAKLQPFLVGPVQSNVPR